MSCNCGNNCNNSCGNRTVITKQGEQGEQGVVGPPGAAGADGAQGPQGDPGANGAISSVQDEGVVLPVQPTLNFVGAGVTGVDNPGNNSTDINIPGTPISAWSTNTILSGAFTTAGSATINSTSNLIVTRTIIDKTAILNFTVTVDVDTVAVNQTVRFTNIDISALLTSNTLYTMYVPVAAVPSGVGTLPTLPAAARIINTTNIINVTDIVIPDIVVGRSYNFNWQMSIALT